jgi:hypothetical protein
MKKILVAVVLGLAVAASGQGAAQPAQGQAAASSPQTSAQGQAPAAASQAPVIKDPAEYNAYVGATGQADPKAKISGLEAFLTQYPNSVMKNTALEVLMGTYQQTGNTQKTLETARKLVAADPNNERALALLAYFDRVLAQNNDPNAKQLLAEGAKYGQQGLDGLAKFTKPDGTSDADFEKTKLQMTEIFDAVIGLGSMGTDNATAIKDLQAAVDVNPPDSQKDFSIVYPLALAYLTPAVPKGPLDPANNVNGIWYATRASVLAPAQMQASLEKYAHAQYVKYHAGEDGWADVLAAAKANNAKPADFAIKPPPTPAEQAHKMVQDTTPDKMDFATWEFVFTNGSQEDQDTVWNAIKGKAVQMNGTVISTTPDEFSIAGSSDDIDAKKADITLKFEDKVPARLIPKDGASFDFQGEPASYTSNPFMMIMEKGQLLRAKPAAPAHKPTAPAHKKPAASQ